MHGPGPWTPGADSPYRAFVPPPPPPRPSVAIFVVIGLGCAALAAFTSHKLYVMAELRGDIAGIPERELVVEGAVRRYQDGTSVYSLRNPDRQGQPWEIQVQFDDIGNYH